MGWGRGPSWTQSVHFLGVGEGAKKRRSEREGVRSQRVGYFAGRGKRVQQERSLPGEEEEEEGRGEGVRALSYWLLVASSLAPAPSLLLAQLMSPTIKEN